MCENERQHVRTCRPAEQNDAGKRLSNGNLRFGDGGVSHTNTHTFEQ